LTKTSGQDQMAHKRGKRRGKKNQKRKGREKGAVQPGGMDGRGGLKKSRGDRRRKKKKRVKTGKAKEINKKRGGRNKGAECGHI